MQRLAHFLRTVVWPSRITVDIGIRHLIVSLANGGERESVPE
jgi:hypothetical protein